MSFDIKIINENSSKKIIHPRYCFDIYIPETITKNGFWARIHINAKKSLNENLSKLDDFITNFNKEYLKNKDLPKKNPKYASVQQGEFLLSWSRGIKNNILN